MAMLQMNETVGLAGQFPGTGKVESIHDADGNAIRSPRLKGVFFDKKTNRLLESPVVFVRHESGKLIKYSGQEVVGPTPLVLSLATADEAAKRKFGIGTSAYLQGVKVSLPSGEGDLTMVDANTFTVNGIQVRIDKMGQEFSSTSDEDA